MRALFGMTAVCAVAHAGPPQAAAELVVVRDGKLRDAVVSGHPWTESDAYVEGKGEDTWLLANRGLAAGDFHLTARVSVHGLAKSAARFSFNRGESSFGFEGNHTKIYITGIVCRGTGSAGALGRPAEAGIEDGRSFLFEVVRAGKTLVFRVNGRDVHTVEAHDGPIPLVGFEPRRARMRIHELTVRGSFLPEVYKDDIWSVWFHAKARPWPTGWHGPFVNLLDDVVLTLVNHDGEVRAFATADDGKTWEPRGTIAGGDQRFEIRNGNADTALLRTRSGVLVVVFLNISGQRVSWDYEKQQPKDDIKRYTWSARSLDDGRTWQDLQVVQRGYAGALRDIIQTRTGEIVVANQNVARNPGRHVSYTYVSADDGLSWTCSNGMDIGGQGDHAGSIEGTLVELRDGRLWVLLRSYHGHFYECFSEDRGRTWSEPVASPIKASGSPGILTRLASGRLVLFWNRFAEGRPKRLGRREELSMAFSEDDGGTWTDPVVVVRERGRRQSYPKVFERRPGELWVSTWQGSRLFKLFESDFR